MTGIEVILLIIGAIIFAASFIFTSKSDTPKNAEIRLSDKQKEDIKNQIMTVFDEQMENLSEQTEIKLDKLSNEKIMEMNEYICNNHYDYYRCISDWRTMSYILLKRMEISSASYRS